MFSEKGMKPDLEKIQEIQETPAPENRKVLKKFSMTDMKRFIRSDSKQTYHFREYYKRKNVAKNMRKLLTILNNL